MKVFVAGGTGAIGRFLLPELVDAGHEVVALARSSEKQRWLESLGAAAVVADPLDREALTEAVRRSECEAVIHELTALAGLGNFKTIDRDLALTNRFRTEVTDTLLAAAREVGARRFIAQSYCGWPFAREGGPVKSEEAPLDPAPPAVFAAALAAIRHLEEAICAAEGLEALALRYGSLYGAGTTLAEDGVMVDLVRKRKLPIVGRGTGVWSFLHIEDAARATRAAVSHGAPGIYNVTDDEPAPVSEWLPCLAEALGARPPRRIPVWLARLAIGEGGVSMMTRIRGGSNAKAKRELDWEPTYASWRQGFVEGLDGGG